jgi:hypothetical protein
MAIPTQETSIPLNLNLADVLTTVDPLDPQTITVLNFFREILKRIPSSQTASPSGAEVISPSSMERFFPPASPRGPEITCMPIGEQPGESSTPSTPTSSQRSPPRVTVLKSTTSPSPSSTPPKITFKRSPPKELFQRELVTQGFEELTHKIVVLPPDLEKYAPYVIKILRYVISKEQYKQECLDALMAAASTPPPLPTFNEPSVVPRVRTLKNGARSQYTRICKECKEDQPLDMFKKWGRTCSDCI